MESRGAKSYCVKLATSFRRVHAAISFAGYFAMKLAGATRGILLTGLLGGMVSSTAITLSFARLSGTENIRPLLCAGILLAAAVMFPRILLEVAVIIQDFSYRSRYP